MRHTPEDPAGVSSAPQSALQNFYDRIVPPSSRYESLLNSESSNLTPKPSFSSLVKILEEGVFRFNEQKQTVLKDATEEEGQGKIQYGFQGLASYVYTCWARELGVVLRPDMVWTTIAFEVAREIAENPRPYQALYVDEEKANDSRGNFKKQTLQFLWPEKGDLPFWKIAEGLREAMPNKQLVDLFTTTRFSSSSAGYEEVCSAILAASASPFYDYLSFMCGIPYVVVEGTKEDWLRVIEKTKELWALIPTKLGGPVGLRRYLQRAAQTVADIVRFGFFDDGALQSAEELRRKKELANSFFSAMFWMTGNCGSGHVYYTLGWLTRLYFKATKTGATDRPERCIPEITSWPSHLAIVGWSQQETGEMFAKAVGLFYGEKSQDILLPHYGQLRCQVFDETAFKILTKKQ